MLKQEGMPDTSKETVLYPASFPIPTEFGVEKEFHTTVGYSGEMSKASGKMVSKTFYHCTVCTKRSQMKIVCTTTAGTTYIFLLGAPGQNVENSTRPLRVSRNMSPRSMAGSFHLSLEQRRGQGHGDWSFIGQLISILFKFCINILLPAMNCIVFCTYV